MLMGEKIRALRLERGLTQHELGEEIGVRWLSICRWENGVRKPYKRHLISLAKFFGITERELTFPKKENEEKENET